MADGSSVQFVALLAGGATLIGTVISGLANSFILGRKFEMKANRSDVDKVKEEFHDHQVEVVEQLATLNATVKGVESNQEEMKRDIRAIRNGRDRR